MYNSYTRKYYQSIVMKRTKLICSGRNQNSGCLYRRVEEMLMIAKGLEGTFQGARNVVSFDPFVSYIGVYICKNLSLYTKICSLYCLCAIHTSMKKLRNKKELHEYCLIEKWIVGALRAGDIHLRLFVYKVFTILSLILNI